jgi:hypothetical protein
MKVTVNAQTQRLIPVAEMEPGDLGINDAGQVVLRHDEGAVVLSSYACGGPAEDFSAPVRVLRPGESVTLTV